MVEKNDLYINFKFNIKFKPLLPQKTISLWGTRWNEVLKEKGFKKIEGEWLKLRIAER